MRVEQTDLAVVTSLLLTDSPDCQSLLALQQAVVRDQLCHVQTYLPLYLSILVLILQRYNIDKVAKSTLI